MSPVTASRSNAAGRVLRRSMKTTSVLSKVVRRTERAKLTFRALRAETRTGEDWDRPSNSFLERGDHQYDRLEVVDLSANSRHAFYLDITEFYGK
jgi:hypothetical protein